jgi:hypothetical protein
MEAKQSSSVFDSLERKMDTITEDNKELDIVTALTTPLQQNVVKRHVESLKKIERQEREIREQQQRQIGQLNFELSIKEAQILNIKNAENIPRKPSLPPALAASETPGPHRLQMKPERPEDIAYKAKLVEQQHAEEAMGQHDSPPSNEALLSVFQSFTKVLKDNNQHLQSSDVTEPTKFNGLDTQWDDFYLQLRTYLEAKGWLDTSTIKLDRAHLDLTQKLTKRFTTSYWHFAARVQQAPTLQKQHQAMNGKQEDTLLNAMKASPSSAPTRFKT